jgi:hypothetical protein
MLIEFSVGNYRSFNEPVTLSMVAADISSKPEELNTTNRFQVAPDVYLLTSAAIYGANASGKSNLIKALNFMRTFVLTSSRETQTMDRIKVDPFLLSTETFHQPSHFEIVFRVDETQYRYGFEVTKQRVTGEWLYYLSSSRESNLFARDTNGIQVSARNFREGKGFEEHTRDNALFLSVVAQFNGKIATTLFKWFRHLRISIGIDDRDFGFAVLRHEDSSYRDDIEQFIKRLDVGIAGFTLEKTPVKVADNVPDFPPAIAEKWLAFVEALRSSDESDEHVNIKIKTLHQRFNAEGQAKDYIDFDLDQESDGTQRLFAFAEPILRALYRGGVLVIDEFDARLHPNLVIALLRLFNSLETNSHHAQLVFTTHNTNLLSAQLFRRDQVWFVEKTRQGASDLYSLVEYRVEGKKRVRNDVAFEKNYIEGRYGAIPFPGDLEQFIGMHVEQEETAN